MDDTAKLLKTVAENEKKVYESGKNTMSRAWWDAVTQGNTRTAYMYGFSMIDFSFIGGFNPPYQIKPVGYCPSIFANTIAPSILAKDIDFGGCTSLESLFSRSVIEYVERIDTTGCSGVNALFSENSTIKKVGKVVLKSDGSQTFNTSAFYSAYNLEEIDFDGTIGNDIWFTYCRYLKKASVENIVDALSGTVSGKTITFSQAMKTREFTDAAWAALVTKKPNWTFSLV